jgi:nicotinamide-nucleotide amidase
MEQRFARSNAKHSENARRQVRILEGAKAYENTAGLAPGFEVVLHGSRLICLPGPPRELKAIFHSHLLSQIDELSKAESGHQIARRIYRVFGQGESGIATKLQGLALGEGASLHYQVKFPETLVKLVVRKPSKAEAESKLNELGEQLAERLGSYLYGYDQDSLAGVVGGHLLTRGERVATAESCTGGMIGSLLTDIAGSSAYFLGGAITYSNEEKTRQLGVPEETLKEHGAVSEAVVRAMAEGARERFASTWAISVSGVAGPGGGSEEKPVGTVWIGVAGPSGCFAKRFCWPGARDQVRALAAHWALDSLRRQILAEAGVQG